MRKAAMPVPYIIALIIGVIVVAVLAYWFVTSGGKGTSIGTEAECTARKLEYCATQTEDVWTKMTEKCGSDKFADKKECGKYCSTIIPTWKAVSGNTHCEK